MAVNAHQMKSLAHIVREGSISAAARALGVTQSAISQHIIRLEAEVGVPVLLRSRDGIALTSVGQEIFELADELTALHQQIEERVRGHVDLRRGNLTIIANAPQPALSLIARYTKRFPDISVDFALLDWATAMDRVNSKQVDIAIITEPSLQKDLLVVPIKKARFVLYAAKSDPISTLSHIRLAEIAEHTLLLPEKGSLTRRTVANAMAKAGVVPKRIVTMTTFPVMKEAILQGIGIGIFLEESSVANDQLCEIPIKDLRQSFETSVVVPKYKAGLRITKSFLETVGDISNY
jgi:molybdate transport repressor ModE-like protein